jgi:hypothetical protein
VSTCQAALHQHQAGLPESSHAIPAATQQHRRVVQLDALSRSTHSLLLHALLALASCAVLLQMQPICALLISINRVLVVVHVDTSLLTHTGLVLDAPATCCRTEEQGDPTNATEGPNTLPLSQTQFDMCCVDTTQAPHCQHTLSQVLFVAQFEL